MAEQIGSFVLERPLGAGSFATVWLAHDPILDDRVAIKVLAKNWAQNADIRDRFIEEARILRRIDHERVIRVHAIAHTEDDCPYFVMSWADAGTLRMHIDDVHDRGEQLSIAEAIVLMTELLDAIAIVHDFGAVHRDIKPTNILFRTVSTHELADARRSGRTIRPDRLVLGDFGLAKDVGAGKQFTRAAGTPLYMAPEQSKSNPVIDRRADLYSASAVLFEMLAGAPPFHSQSLAQVDDRDDHDIAARLLKHRPTVPPALARIVARGLQRQPADRWQTADEIREVLHSVPTESVALPPLEPDILQQFRDGKFTLPGPLVDEFERFLSSVGAARFGLPETASRSDAVYAAATLTDKWRGLLGSDRIPFRARAASEDFVFEVERVWLELTSSP